VGARRLPKLGYPDGAMKKLLGPYSDFLFAVLRIVAALMFLSHGLQKFNVAMLGGFKPPFFLLEAAAWIETIGAILIIVGLGTRWVAFVLSGEMAVAYFTSHAGTVLGPLNAPPGPGPHSFFPHLNGGEIAVLYCFLWLYLAARGPGRWSLDGALGLNT
jgi:putative oxidoreductase